MRKIATFILVLVFTSYANGQVSSLYQVYAVAFTNPIKQAGKWSAVRQAPDSLEMCYMVWVIKGNNKVILVDAGYVLSDSAQQADKTGYIRPDRALQKLNLKPTDITDIIVSHPHADHIGGIDLFPQAVVWMQQGDYNYFVGAAWQPDGKRFAFNQEDVKKIVNINLKGRLKLVHGDDMEIMEGIRVFVGSKHTFESQYVQVVTGDERIIIASDNVWFYHNLENLASATITFDTSAYVRQMKRMKTLASDQRLIIPGHDVKIFKRFPQVAEGVVKISRN